MDRRGAAAPAERLPGVSDPGLAAASWAVSPGGLREAGFGGRCPIQVSRHCADWKGTYGVPLPGLSVLLCAGCGAASERGGRRRRCVRLLRMSLGAYDSIPYFAHGASCAMLALATVATGTLRHRLYHRNLWLFCGFGMVQGCALLCFPRPDQVWPHVLLKTAAALLFFLVGWLNLRDFVLRRGVWWHRLVPYLPLAALPVALAVEPRWLGV